MSICTTVLVPLPRRDDASMVNVYMNTCHFLHVGMWALRNLKFWTRLYIMGSASYLVYIVELTFLLSLSPKWLHDKQSTFQ